MVLSALKKFSIVATEKILIYKLKDFISTWIEIRLVTPFSQLIAQVRFKVKSAKANTQVLL